MERTLIRGGTVISQDPNVGNFVAADVLLEDSKIVEVSKSITATDFHLVDASEMIVMPGFVDTHRHMWQGVLRNAGTASLRGNSSGHQHSASRFRPEDVFASTFSSALNAIDAGITTVLNFSDIHQSEAHAFEDFRALAEAGIRSVFALSPRFSNGKADPLHTLRDLAAELPNKGDLISLALATSDLGKTPVEDLAKQWALARELGLRIAAQIGVEGADLSAAQKAGLLGADVVYAHGNTLNEKNLRLIKDSAGHLSICPSAEAMLGYGQPMIQRALDMGFAPGLGTDSESVVRPDMLTQMRGVISMQHAMSFEKKLAHRLSPARITTRDVIGYATVAGARAIGLDNVVGSLTPGKQADILLMHQGHINVFPVNDPIGAVVWAMDTSNVDSVFVAGKARKRNGELLAADLASLGKMVSQARDHVLGKAKVRR